MFMHYLELYKLVQITTHQLVMVNDDHRQDSPHRDLQFYLGLLLTIFYTFLV